MTGINRLGAEWRNDLQIGTAPRFESEFYQPLSFDSRYFVAPRLRLGQRNLKAFSNDESIARFRVSEAEFGFRHWDVNWVVGASSVSAHFAVSVKPASRWAIPCCRTSNLKRVVFLPGLVSIRSMTRKYPSRVAVANLSGCYRDRDLVQTAGSIRCLQPWTRSGRGGRMTRTRCDSDSNSRQLSNRITWCRTSSRWVASFACRAWSAARSAGPHAGLARLMYYRQLGGARSFLDMPLYVGASLKLAMPGRVVRTSTVGSLIVNGSLFAGIDTYVGLLFLGAGFSEAGDSSFYLFVGDPRR